MKNLKSIFFIWNSNKTLSIQDTLTLHNAIFIRKSSSSSKSLLPCSKIFRNIPSSKSIEYHRSPLFISSENITIQHPVFGAVCFRQRITEKECHKHKGKNVCILANSSKLSAKEEHWGNLGILYSSSLVSFQERTMHIYIWHCMYFILYSLKKSGAFILWKRHIYRMRWSIKDVLNSKFSTFWCIFKDIFNCKRIL